MGRAAGFASAQMGVLALNAACGMTLAWLLPKTEYAWLTICNGMIASIAVMCDPATGTGIQSIGGKIWQDRTSMAGLVRTALALRFRLITLVALLWLPWTLWLLLKNGAAYGPALLLTALSLLAVLPATSSAIYAAVLRLHSQVRALQYCELLSAGGRLTLSVALVLLMPSSSTALFASAMAFFILSGGSRWRVQPLVSPAPEAIDTVTSLTWTRQMWRQFWQMLPHAAYMGFHGQFGAWALSLHASTSQVADYGALLRLSILLGLAGALFQQVIVPAIARIQELSQRLQFLRRVVAGYSAVAAALVGITWLFPAPFLWLLGPQYWHLQSELPLAMIYFSLTTFSIAIWWINTATARTSLAWLVPPVCLALLLAALTLLSITSVKVAFLTVSAAMLPSCLIGLAQAFRAMPARQS